MKKLVKLMCPVEVLAETDAILGEERQAAMLRGDAPPDRSEYIVGVLRSEFARRKASTGRQQ
jgi:hypothetical protein